MTKQPKYQIKECTGMEQCISEVKILRNGRIVYRCSREEAPIWVQQAIADEAHPNFN